jgi:positive phototaxis protein PixI
MTKTALPLNATAPANAMANAMAAPEGANRFLTVHVARQKMAMLPTHNLIEVLTLPPDFVVAIPDTPDCVMGVCNWRGEVLWLLDGGHLLTDTPSFEEADYQTKFSVIVLQQGMRSLGVVVDRVGNMLWCHENEIQADDAEALPQMVLGHWQAEKGEKIYVFDAEAILDAFT